MASDQEQKSINVRQRKRLAQGEKLDGTSYQPKGGSDGKKQHSGLDHVKNKSK